MQDATYSIQYTLVIRLSCQDYTSEGLDGEVFVVSGVTFSLYLCFVVVQLLRTLAVGRRQQSESIEVTLDME